MFTTDIHGTKKKYLLYTSCIEIVKNIINVIFLFFNLIYFAFVYEYIN